MSPLNFIFLAALRSLAEAELAVDSDVIEGQSYMYGGGMYGGGMPGGYMPGMHHGTMPYGHGGSLGGPMYGYGGSYYNPGMGMNSHMQHGNQQASQHGSNAGHYNQGNNYSNRSGWNQGYNNTDSSSHNTGANNSNYGSQHGGAQHGSHQNFYHRRLSDFPVEAETTEEPFVVEQSEDEIDGQHYPSQYGYGPSYHYPPVHGHIRGSPYGAQGGVQYGNTQFNGQYDANRGYHNQGNNYSNRSGYNQGYNHTDRNSHNQGGHHSRGGANNLASNILNTIFSAY